MSERKGQPFGAYELYERLGYGGMAEVYRARYTPSQGVTKPVVIKRILPHLADNADFVSMFESEARVSMGLSHGNIAQLFDFGQVDGTWFIAMELVDGRPLSKVLQRAQKRGLSHLPALLAVHVAIEMCKGLHYAHTRKGEDGQPLEIVHRDVSPDNVLVSYEGQVKLVDFGIAKAKLAGRLETEPGVVKGKVMYLSPEQARGEPVDARSDVFATGVVLFRLLCGRLPVEGNEHSVMLRIAYGKLPRLRELAPEMPRALEEILVRALAGDRRERFESCQQLQEALTGWLYETEPRFPASALGHLMAYLFQEELAAEGRSFPVPADFPARLESWMGAPVPTPRPSQPTPAAARATAMAPIRTSEATTREAPNVGATPRGTFPLPRLAIAGGVGGVLVVLGITGWTLLEGPEPGQSVGPPPPAPVVLPATSRPEQAPAAPEKNDVELRQGYSRLADEAREASANGQRALAKELRRKAFSLRPNSVEAAVELGIAEMEDDPDIAAYRRAVELFEASPPTDSHELLVKRQVMLAVAYLAAGNIERGDLIYEGFGAPVSRGSWAQAVPADTATGLGVLKVRGEQKDLGTARSAVVLFVDHGTGRPLHCVVTSMEPSLNREALARMLELIRRGAPQNMNVVLALGLLHRSLNQTVKANAYLETYLRAVPDGPWTPHARFALRNPVPPSKPRSP